MLKFKFLQILLGDKNATYLCSKTISTLKDSEEKIEKSNSVLGGDRKRDLGIKMDGRGGTRDAVEDFLRWSRPAY